MCPSLRTLVAILGLTLGLLAPAVALSPSQKAVVLSGGYAPAVYTDFTAINSTLPSSLYTYSGPSLRTIIDATGVITYAPNNLLTYSNTFSNAAWSASHATVTSNTSDVTDPLGGNSANKIVTANAADNFVGQISATGYTIVGRTFMFSFWARTLSGTAVVPIIGDDVAGKFWSDPSVNTVSVTAAWQHFAVYGVAPSGSIGSGPRVGFGGYSTWETAQTIYVYGATLSAVTYETTPRPGDQVITTSAAYYGPAFDYDPTALAPRGLRVEEARTNLYLNSGAPATQTIAVVNGSAYSISFYGTGVLTLSGALTQVMTGSAYPARTTYTGTTSTTSLVVTVTTLGAMSYPQVELGAFPTSAIPSGASAVTRAADVVGIVGPALGVLQGASWSAVVESSGVNASVAMLIGGQGPLNYYAYISSNVVSAYNGTTGFTDGTVTPTNTNRVAVTASKTQIQLASNGTSPSNYSATFPSSSSRYLGTQGSADFIGGYIRKLALYNSVLHAPVLQRNTLLGTPLH